VISLETTLDGALGPGFSRAGVKVLRIAKRPRGFDLSLFPRILAALVRDGVDVVHTHNQLPLIYASPVGRIARARVVHTEHGRHPGTARQLMLRRLGARACHALVCVSQPTLDYAVEIDLAPRSALRVILNGTDVRAFRRDPERRAAARAAWGVGEDAVVIGTVGRMAPVKNHALLVRAAAPLLGEHATLVIAGDGSERAATEALAAELGVADRVRLLGEIDDVPTALSGFDLFALSSRSEGLPMALTEAMSASLPVVATAVGGVPNVVKDGETGLLAPAGDVEQLRARLRELVDDPAKRDEMGKAALADAERRYSLARMAREYMALYRED
jgi:glycosyltransferase involved in cell wall biosynthesis